VSSPGNNIVVVLLRVHSRDREQQSFGMSSGILEDDDNLSVFLRSAK